jgi:hypothetical protein
MKFSENYFLEACTYSENFVSEIVGGAEIKTGYTLRVGPYVEEPRSYFVTFLLSLAKKEFGLTENFFF